MIRVTISHSPYIKSTAQHQHTSLISLSSYTDYCNVHKLNLAAKLPTCFQSTNAQRYTAVTGWLIQANRHARGTTTIHVTRPPPHNIAVTCKQLHSKTAPLLKTNSSV